jgi:hypothetical protein
MLSVPVSLSRFRKYCCLPRVSHSRLHPPTHPFPTRRLPWLGSPVFTRYYECATTSDCSWLTLRSSLHARYPVDRFFRSSPSNDRLADARSCSAGEPRLRPSFRETVGSAKFPGNPCARPALARPTHTYALFSDPGRTSRAHLNARSVLSQTLERQGLRPCVDFGVLSHGSVLAVYASCQRHR